MTCVIVAPSVLKASRFVPYDGSNTPQATCVTIGQGGPLSMPRGGSTYCVTTDAMGSVRQLVNAGRTLAGGLTAWREGVAHRASPPGA